MKILIDGQTLLTPEINRGIGKYYINIDESILSVDFTNDFYLVVPGGSKSDVFGPWAREKLHVIEQRTNGHARGSEEALTSSYSDNINDLISQTGIDLYWSPNALMDSVFLPARKVNGCRYSATIFDLIPLVMEDHFKKAWPSTFFARPGSERIEFTFVWSDEKKVISEINAQNILDDVEKVFSNPAINLGSKQRLAVYQNLHGATGTDCG